MAGWGLLLVPTFPDFSAASTILLLSFLADRIIQFPQDIYIPHQPMSVGCRRRVLYIHLVSRHDCLEVSFLRRRRIFEKGRKMSIITFYYSIWHKQWRVLEHVFQKYQITPIQNGTQDRTPFSCPSWTLHGLLIESVSSRNLFLSGQNSTTGNKKLSSKVFLELTVGAKWATQQERVWKTVLNNGVITSVQFCLR